MSGDSDLLEKLREVVTDAVRDELRKFKEAEIVPLQQKVNEILVNKNTKSEACSPVLQPNYGRAMSTPLVSPRSPGASIPTSPSFLQRVGSKVAQSTAGFFSLDAEKDPSSQSMEERGPITVRRNSGVSRLADQQNLNSLDYNVPRLLVEGVSIIRITHNKKTQRILKLDEKLGIVTWNNKQTSRLYLDRICEIYVGDEAKNYREEFGVSIEHSERWATIIHQRPKETKIRALHLVMSSKSDFDVFLKSILTLVRYRRESMGGLALAGNNFVDIHWKRTNSESVTFNQVLIMLKQMHIHCSVPYVRKLYDSVDLEKTGRLNFAEFKEFVKLLEYRSDIADIYNEYKIGESVNNLLSFFTDVQGQPIPSSVKLPLVSAPSLKEFGNILLQSRAISGNISLKGNSRPPPSLNLSLPLNNYFISSSHNTYLSGRQVADGSSVESCIRALQDGCRCLELDCWDGPANKGSPVVYHGSSVGRLTSSVIFSDAVESILKYAFISSPYPLILSLEIRCNETSQLQIVSILKSVFGNLLVTEKLDPDSFELPSPESLKHRILIKVKGLGIDDSTSDISDPSEHSERSDSSASSFTLSLKERKTKLKIVPALAELGVYFSGKKFDGFDEKEKFNTVYSFNERTIRKMSEAKLLAFSEYNRDHLSRVYPSPMRISSTNFDPIFFWKHGVQMVALNWQKWDLGMQLNNAFFPSKIGYTLKPAFMRDEAHFSLDADKSKPDGTDLAVPDVPVIRDAFSSLNFNDESLSESYTLKIKVISAQQLPRPKFLSEEDIFSPYVIVEAFGLGDLDSQLAPQWRTSSVFDNGFNPVWNYDCESKIKKEDLEFVCLRFSVATDTRVFAHFTAKLALLPRGYQHCPLQDVFGEDYIFSSLFIKTAVDM